MLQKSTLIDCSRWLWLEEKKKTKPDTKINGTNKK